MPVRRAVRRILVSILATALGFLFLAFLLIQIEQHILRHRAQRLLADFHSIRLRQSTWSDAQSLIHKWYDFGEADGKCTETQCAYAIRLKDGITWLADIAGENWNDRLVRFHAYQLLERLGAHPSDLAITFIVQDGRIVRSSAFFEVQVPPHTTRTADDYGFALIIAAKTRSVLREHPDSKLTNGWILGDEEQLADHPDYKAGRPGGYKICEMGEITYTPFLAPSEIERLTSFNLDCMTRFRSCRTIEDILPAAKPWHLYDEDATAPGPNTPRPPSHPCTTAPRALGRDTQIALEVEAITMGTKLHPAKPPYTPAESYETSTVHLLRVLKGSSIQLPGENFLVRPFATTSPYDRPHQSEHLLPHHRYIVLFDADRFNKEEDVIATDWCGVLDDIPSVVASINEGLSQIDTLRRSEIVFTHR